MRNRLIYAAVGVVGVLLIGLAIASATAWRADDVLQASATADQAVLVTDPGVLEMAGDPVTVTATVPAGDHVVLAVGRDTDVDGWVGTDPHQRVAGLAGWHALALASPRTPDGPTTSPGATGSPTPTPSESRPADAATTGAAVPDAAASDMWVTLAQGTGSATLTWPTQPGRWSLLVVGSTATGTGVPPTLSLAWPRTVTTPYLVPGTVLGGLLVLACLALFWRELRHRHGAADWTPVLTDAIPVVTGPGAGTGGPLTRRQLREMAELARTGQLPVVRDTATPAASEVPVVAARRTAAEPVTGAVPVVPAAPDERVAAGSATVAGARAATASTTAPDEPTAVGATPVPGGPAPRAAESAAAPDAAAGPATELATEPAAEAGRWSRWRRAAVPASEAPATAPAVDEPATEPAVEGAATEPAVDVPVADVPVADVAPVMPAAAAAARVPVPDTAAVPVVGPAEQQPVLGSRRARRHAASSAEVVGAPSWAPDTTPAASSADPAGTSVEPTAPTPAAAAPSASTEPVTGRPAWVPRRPAPPVPVPVPVASTPAAGPAAPQHTPGPAPAPGAAPVSTPAWLSRVAARWEQEDAAAEAEETAVAPTAPRERSEQPSSATVPGARSGTVAADSSSAHPAGDSSGEPEDQATSPATQPESSRADAWRRAWGLPPLDIEEEDR